MTLIVALECREGIVLASESQSTFTTQGQWTKTQGAPKLAVLAGSIIWGGSGFTGTIDRVHAEVERQAGNIVAGFAKGREPGAKELHKYVNGIQKQVAAELLPSAGDTYETGFLFAGYSKDGPYILECDRKGTRDWHHERHFQAIGSGDIFAMHAWVSVAHHNIANLSLLQGEALAYRTIEDAVATAAFGLGGKVQMCVVTPDGKARALDKTELQAIDDAVRLWKQREVEVVAGLAATAAPDAAEAANVPTLPQEG